MIGITSSPLGHSLTAWFHHGSRLLPTHTKTPKVATTMLSHNKVAHTTTCTNTHTPHHIHVHTTPLVQIHATCTHTHTLIHTQHLQHTHTHITCTHTHHHMPVHRDATCTHTYTHMSHKHTPHSHTYSATDSCEVPSAHRV